MNSLPIKKFQISKAVKLPRFRCASMAEDAEELNGQVDRLGLRNNTVSKSRTLT